LGEVYAPCAMVNVSECGQLSLTRERVKGTVTL
jgi:hypothetical protein